LFMSMTHAPIHAVCTRPFCMSTSMLHVHIQAARTWTCNRDADTRQGREHTEIHLQKLAD
jgi:hypothetical protein